MYRVFPACRRFDLLLWPLLFESAQMCASVRACVNCVAVERTPVVISYQYAIASRGYLIKARVTVRTKVGGRGSARGHPAAPHGHVGHATGDRTPRQPTRVVVSTSGAQTLQSALSTRGAIPCFSTAPPDRHAPFQRLLLLSTRSTTASVAIGSWDTYTQAKRAHTPTGDATCKLASTRVRRLPTRSIVLPHRTAFAIMRSCAIGITTCDFPLARKRGPTTRFPCSSCSCTPASL